MDGNGRSFPATTEAAGATVARPCAEADRLVHSRIGSAIRRRRQLMGLSLRELARTCGISLQQIQKYEVGTSSISAAQLWKVAYSLAVPVEHFYERLEHERLEAVAPSPATCGSAAA